MEPVMIFFVSYMLNLAIIWLSHKKKIGLDHQAKPQKVHKRVVPRIGGLGIFFASLLLIRYPLGANLLIAAFPAFLAGFIEDLVSDISPKIRLGIISLSGILGIALLGNLITDFEFAILPTLLSVPFTIFMVAGLTNAVNIIDGLNGLASGFSILALAFFAFAAYLLGDTELSRLLSLFIFPILGFFVLNFPKAFIFLGDSGSYFLGFILAESGILLMNRNPEISSYFPFLILFYPVWEVLFSIYRRRFLRKGEAMAPDKLHLHSLLYKRTPMTNPGATTIIVFSIAGFNLAGLLFLKGSWVQLALIGLLILLYLFMYRKFTSFRQPF